MFNYAAYVGNESVDACAAHARPCTASSTIVLLTLTGVAVHAFHGRAHEENNAYFALWLYEGEFLQRWSRTRCASSATVQGGSRAYCQLLFSSCKSLMVSCWSTWGAWPSPRWLASTRHPKCEPTRQPQTRCAVCCWRTSSPFRPLSNWALKRSGSRQALDLVRDPSTEN